MSDTPEVTPVVDELTLLKKRADQLGIQYHPNIGIDTLRKKIESVLSPDDEPAKEAAPSVPEEPVKESPGALRQRKYREARQLVRVRVSCMNPSKNAWPGEVFTFSNSVVGTVRRFVPFTAENGWHVERVILQQMKDRKYAHFYEVKENGRAIKKVRLVPEFNIEILPALTQEQLNELGQRQAATGSIDQDV